MIIGTAGHIDHGKSALVTALTGRTVDRLAEEKRRGITIELNFAPLLFEGLPPAGIVDVPGHEDFVRMMVAGASGIDLVLLVVDLAEGARPQTEEHLAVLEQLRIPRGIPVFTKVDLVEPAWAELVVEDVMERLRASTVRFDEPSVVSARTGQGIDALRARLRSEVEQARERAGDDAFRLPVDRVFSLAGVGTVVTGTAWSGTVRVGDTVAILPGDHEARVRSVESYGEQRDTALPGNRVALGLTGVDRDAVARGAAVVDRRIPWRATTSFDAELELLVSAGRPLAPRSRVRVHVGTAEMLGRVYPRGPIEPGARGLARISLEAPAVVRGGDRIVLRSYSPVTTIGGGRVLDPDPPRGAPWPETLAAEDAARRLTALVSRRRRGLARTEVEQTLGVRPGEVEAMVRDAPAIVDLAGTLFPADLVRQRGDRLGELLAEHHRRAPAETGLSLEAVRRRLGLPPAATEALLDRLERDHTLVRREGVAALPSFRPRVEGGEAAIERLVERLVAAGLEPPTLAELADELEMESVVPLVRLAVDRGAIAAVERDRYFSVGALERFRATLDELGHEGGITPAAIRERLGLSRKFTIPLLEWADRQGITRRVGDARVLTGSGR
jgi:selenocysteine-specific elongation factor